MFRNTAAYVLAALLATGVASSALAETQFQKDHPRRAEVNHRLNHQDRRIHHEVKDGQISHKQAAALHKDDRHIRGEERHMASRDNGHITKPEQRALNHQENGVSKDIGK
jgi:hypothetical protein